jgi:hypothetical protein
VISPGNAFKTTTSSNSGGGRGRGGRSTDERYNTCDTLSTYLTSINTDTDCHLLPLLIKVAEMDEGEDVDVPEGRLSPTPQSEAKDTESKDAEFPTNHHINSQGLYRPFPVQKYYSTLDP